MSLTLQALRASIAVGSFLMAGATVHAAEATVQRLAMACPHGHDAAGCKAAPMPVLRQAASVQRAEMAKAPARRAQQRVASQDSDGSRFTYDSCGCSN